MLPKIIASDHDIFLLFSKKLDKVIIVCCDKNILHMIISLNSVWLSRLYFFLYLAFSWSYSFKLLVKIVA